MTTATFYYHPDGYETRREQLMGRHAAGEAFLRSYVESADGCKLFCYAQSREHFDHFLSKINEYTRRPVRCSWIPWGECSRLHDAGTLYMPGPNIHDLAWQRRYFRADSYSLCGITHTTATHNVMDAIGQFLTAPFQPWDAVICTSHAVKDMVQQTLDGYSDYLQSHFQLPHPPKTSLQLPVIPLGVNFPDFNPPESARQKQRNTWRSKMQIADEDAAFLFVGRLSFHAKSHPVPMFISLQRATTKTERRIHLILSGWFPSKAAQDEYISAARQFCPNVNVHIVDGRKPNVRTSIWHAADAFISLSDNIQETFGLTPIEAMAAGLPCVVSDWDGYKETVRHDVDGFRIPTWMPPQGSLDRVAFAHASGVLDYDHYVGIYSQFVAVDIEATADACARLCNESELRTKMGQAGKQRAQQVFDWPIIIKQYQSLWSDLASLREKAPSTVPSIGNAATSPLRDDPSRLFRSYPTAPLSKSMVVHKEENNDASAINSIRTLSMNRIADKFGADETNAAAVLAEISEPTSIGSLLDGKAESEQRQVVLTLLWLAKYGLLQVGAPRSQRVAPTP